MDSRNKKTFIALILAAVLLAAVPVITLKDAEFGGSDDAGSGVVEEIHDDYQPWFTPVLETFLHGEIPGELESLLFCIQTGIGVGVIAFFMGRFVERKKWMKAMEQKEGRDSSDPGEIRAYAGAEEWLKTCYVFLQAASNPIGNAAKSK